MTKQDEVKSAIETAVRFAIKNMGVDKFKKTSFFGSNDPERTQLDQAA
ncbi:hypothetical protein [Pacificibacter marinus]|nr:hypothetical protein [Pacificibacter marinus]MBU2867077.1 hypothetical protein [Pacificibacter marinus]